MANPFDNFLNAAGVPGHDYRASILEFPSIDVGKISTDLCLVELGKERGQDNQPKPKSTELDSVELQAISLVEEVKKRSHEQYTEQITETVDRLNAIDFDLLTMTVTSAVRGNLADFERAARQGLDDINTLKERVVTSALQLSSFARNNNIERPAFERPSFGAGWGIIITIAALEVLANAGLMGEAYATGFIGAATVAVILAVLNVGSGVAGGYFGWRSMHHRNLANKVGGAAITIIHLIFLSGLNLFVGLMRDALQRGDVYENLGTVWEQTLSLDIKFTGFESPIMMVLGAAASLFTAYKGFKLDDPDPIYGLLSRIKDQSEEDYAIQESEIGEQLQEMRDDAVTSMKESATELAKHRSEFNSVLSALQKVRNRYEAHLDDLERAANHLLAIYRESNVLARKNKAPTHFTKRYLLKRPETDPIHSADRYLQYAEKNIEGALESCHDLLVQGIEQINSAYEEAYRKFEQIEVMVKEGEDGGARPQ